MHSTWKEAQEEIKDVCYFVETAVRPSGDKSMIVVPHVFETGIFKSGIARKLEGWRKGTGQITDRFFSRYYRDTDLLINFRIVEMNNRGLFQILLNSDVLFIRNFLQPLWQEQGYTYKEGWLWEKNTAVPIPSESLFFQRLGIPYIKREDRNIVKGINTFKL